MKWYVCDGCWRSFIFCHLSRRFEKHTWLSWLDWAQGDGVIKKFNGSNEKFMAEVCRKHQMLESGRTYQSLI